MAVKVLIFGAAGGVAGFATKYVAARKAEMTLAMRNPDKPVPGVNTDHVSRVRADLTDPASVASAATSQGSPFDSAFIYQAPQAGGTPRATIQALKDGGVRHVVFLSSYSVSDPISSIPEDEAIPYRHGQTELDLEAIYGEGNFTAVRPSYLVTNTFQFTDGIKNGLVKVPYPENQADLVSSQDVGEVAGQCLLEQGPLPRTLDVTGQQKLSIREVIQKLVKATGKGDDEVKIEQISEEESMTLMTEVMGLPRPLAEYLAKIGREEDQGNFDWTTGDRWENGQKTVKRVVGRDGIKFEDWIEDNKGAFT